VTCISPTSAVQKVLAHVSPIIIQMRVVETQRVSADALVLIRKDESLMTEIDPREDRINILAVLALEAGVF
jgi:hypothetical protein